MKSARSRAVVVDDVELRVRAPKEEPAKIQIIPIFAARTGHLMEDSHIYVGGVINADEITFVVAKKSGKGYAVLIATDDGETELNVLESSNIHTIKRLIMAYRSPELPPVTFTVDGVSEDIIGVRGEVKAAAKARAVRAA